MSRNVLPVWVLLGLFSTPPAHAEDSKAQCLEAYEQGQRARKAGAFARAKEELAFCGSSACPNALHPDCMRWLAEVESAMPRVTFEISSRAGGELDTVGVTIDGGTSRSLDGGALPFDPGDHVVVIESSGYRSEERRFTIAEGQTLTITVVLEPISEAAPSPIVSARAASAARPSEPAPMEALRHEQSATLLPTFVGAGIGVLGAASFAYFGATARHGDRALADCTPDCSERKVDRVKRDYLIANVSLGIGAVGLLGAGAWAIFRPREPAGNTTRAARSTFELRLGPICSVTGHF